jgi:shikimate kinase
VGHIILAGFMATGKTEVGRRLAQRLGRAFVDTDALVEADAGSTVASIFAAEGEAAFRARERAAVERACGMLDAVIAIGGGALLDAENRRRLTAAGAVVCLTATPQEILRRVGNAASRPLLRGPGNRLERIRTLMAERAPVYALATHTVDTTGLSVDQITDRVRSLVADR